MYFYLEEIMKKIFPAERFHDQLGHSLQLNKLCEVKKMHQAPCMNMEDRQLLDLPRLKRATKQRNKGVYTQSWLSCEFHTLDVLAEDVLV